MKRPNPYISALLEQAIQGQTKKVFPSPRDCRRFQLLGHVPFRRAGYKISIRGNTAIVLKRENPPEGG